MPKTPSKIKPLGAYLNRFCGDEMLSRALGIQRSFTDEGKYRPLGRILVEEGSVEESLLQECLRNQREDVIRSLDLFASLPVKAVVKMAAAARQEIFETGSVIYRHSDSGEYYYIIISGSVKVERSTAGDEVLFAVYEPSEGFGEIALLTDKPRTASVETLERTCLLMIPKDVFLQTVFSYPDVSQTFAKLLADRVIQRDFHIVEVAAAEQAFKQFISGHLKQKVPQLIGDSPAITALRDKISSTAQKDHPLLILGEQGTETWDIAALVHKEGRRKDETFLSMDATRPEAGEDFPPCIYSDRLLCEIAQGSVLFGRRQGALPFAPDKRLGLLRMAHPGTVVIEHVEHLTLAVQKQLAEYLATGTYQPLGETHPATAATRIAVTSSADLKSLVETGMFDARLYELLREGLLTIPPLKSRKRDIHLIVDELIRTNTTEGNPLKGVDEAAYNALMAYDWPDNVEELAIVIRRAISVSHSDMLTLQDIFIGPPPVSGKTAYNLLKLQNVRNFFLRGNYPLLAQILVAPSIILILALGLFGNQSPDRNVALILTWGLWEPILVLSTFFVARSWCAVCPIGAASQALGSYSRFKMKTPEFLQKYGHYLTAAGLVIIFWSESAVNMPSSPRATATLIATIILLALASGILFRRRVWCRHLCPLGGLLGVLSSCSIMEMRSNYSICAHDCKHHECYSGNAESEGCPMSEGPFSLRNNQNCILCGKCIKICPHKSPVLNIRIPGHELWASRMPDDGFIALGIALIGTQVFRGLERGGYFSTLSGNASLWWSTSLLLYLAMVFASYLFIRAGGHAVFKETRTTTSVNARFLLYCLVPLVVSFEIAFHLERLMLTGGQILPVIGRQTGLNAELPAVTFSLVTVKILGILIVQIGTLASFWILRRFLTPKDGQSPAPLPTFRNSWPILTFAFLYLWLVIA